MNQENKNEIRTLVVEDEEKIAAGICSKISGLDGDFVIVGRASNGKEALELFHTCHPHVIFTDIAMPEMNGMELSRQIRRLSPNTVVVIISGYSDFSYAQQCMKYGVSNYLLKPLQDDTLLETLFDIKRNLSHFSVREQRHILYSDGFDVIQDDTETYLLANICMGNVIYNSQDEEVLRFYQEQAEQVQWNKIMAELFDEEMEWFAADEHFPNQKMIAVKIRHAKQEEILRMLQKLPVLVQEYTDLPVNICITKQGVLKEEVWNCTKRLRNIMKQRLVIGYNGCFYLEDDEKISNDMLEIVKMKLNTYIKNYFISTNLENFLNEMQTIFKYMQSNHATQESIEKVCIYVIRLLDLSKMNQEGFNLEEIQERMIRSISIIASEKELFETLFGEFQKLNHYMETLYEDNIEKRLFDYVNEHYLTIESVEKVADEFGYNYAYLSRLFKKKVGKSMNRYITEKKMSLAKELLEKHPDLSLVEISEMCGYNDYRYFSRVFKGETGEAPSEYREGL